jgi:hypothetical protein
MNDPATARIAAFRARLENERIDYLHMTPPRDAIVHIRFMGTFAGQPVIWDAKIMTLAHPGAAAAGGSHASGKHQFIDIDTDGDDIRGIRIGLPLGRIDTPAILKTIIMIRKYKRLHTGYHAFNAT